MNQNIILPSDKAADIIAMMLMHLADWPIRSAEAFRNTLLGDGMFAINPLLPVREYQNVEFLMSTIKNTVAEGRMIDFGFIPNAVLKQESNRSRDLFEARELQHPYDDWLAVTSWEGGYNGYHISPNLRFPGEILVIELYGVSLPEMPNAVLVYDIISIDVKGPGDTRVAPSLLQYHETESQLRARGANALDPLVTMLRLLADASVPVTVHDAPLKLNRNRARQGRFAIPGHTTVHTRDYVASFHTAAGRRSGTSGTHASPIAHWRRAHQRHLVNGRVVPVRSSKVNWRDAQELHRLFYRCP